MDWTLGTFTLRSSLPRSRFVSSRSATAVWKAISEAVHSELIQLAFHIGGFLLFHQSFIVFLFLNENVARFLKLNGSR